MFVNKLFSSTDSRQFNGIHDDLRSPVAFDLRVLLPLGSLFELLGHWEFRLYVQSFHPISQCFPWYAVEEKGIQVTCHLLY